MTSEQITQIILALIGLIGTSIGSMLIPYIRLKTTNEQRENTYIIAKLAVQAAEQIFGKEDCGIEKYDYVVKYMKKLNVKLDEKDMKVVIESAVNELNTAKDELFK